MLCVFADVVALCVYLEEMPAAVKRISRGLMRRWRENPHSPMDLIVGANSVCFGPKLEAMFLNELPEELGPWFQEKVGVVEALLRRTCVDPDPETAKREALSVRTNGFPELVLDAEDPEIEEAAQQAYRQSCQALQMEYQIREEEMREYEKTLQAYVVTPALEDQVQRTGYNPLRKLGRGERILGPALLCERHGLPMEGILETAAYALWYYHEKDPFSIEMREMIERKGIEAAVNQICQLEEHPHVCQSICFLYRGLAGRGRLIKSAASKGLGKTHGQDAGSKQRLVIPGNLLYNERRKFRAMGKRSRTLLPGADKTEGEGTWKSRIARSW